MADDKDDAVHTGSYLGTEIIPEPQVNLFCDFVQCPDGHDDKALDAVEQIQSDKAESRETVEELAQLEREVLIRPPEQISMDVTVNPGEEPSADGICCIACGSPTGPGYNSRDGKCSCCYALNDLLQDEREIVRLHDQMEVNADVLNIKAEYPEGESSIPAIRTEGIKIETQPEGESSIPAIRTGRLDVKMEVKAETLSTTDLQSKYHDRRLLFA